VFLLIININMRSLILEKGEKGAFKKRICE
jgi:hypothetical protein